MWSKTVLLVGDIPVLNLLRALNVIPQALHLIRESSAKAFFLSVSAIALVGITPAAIGVLTKLMVDRLASGSTFDKGMRLSLMTSPDFWLKSRRSSRPTIHNRSPNGSESWPLKCSFAYPGSAETIFDGLSLELRAGEVTGLVGINGAGKTTLVKLLTRLYQPQQGKITLNGVDISLFDFHEYRDCFGVLLQDFARYQFTARENILLGRYNDSANRNRLLQAATEAGATTMIEPYLKAGKLGWDGNSMIVARIYRVVSGNVSRSPGCCIGTLLYSS